MQKNKPVLCCLTHWFLGYEGGDQAVEGPPFHCHAMVVR